VIEPQAQLQHIRILFLSHFLFFLCNLLTLISKLSSSTSFPNGSLIVVTEDRILLLCETFLHCFASNTLSNLYEQRYTHQRVGATNQTSYNSPVTNHTSKPGMVFMVTNGVLRAYREQLANWRGRTKMPQRTRPVEKLAQAVARCTAQVCGLIWLLARLLLTPHSIPC
jgi:hypothetical protein